MAINKTALPWRAIIILTTLNILSYMDRQLLALLAVPIERSLGINDVQLGLLQGFAFSIVFVLASVPVGWAVDNGRRSWLVFGGVTTWSIATMGSGLARSFSTLFLCRVGVGAGEATLAPAAYAILMENTPKGRLGSSMGMYAIGASVGIAASLTFGGLVIGALAERNITLPLIGRVEAWQAAFLILGLPGTILAFAAFWLPLRIPATPNTQTDKTDKASFLRFLVANKGAVLSQQIGFATLGLSGYAIAGWAPAHFARSFGWRPEMIGPTLGVAIGLSGIVGTLLAGVVADRLYRSGRRAAYFETHIVTTAIGAPLIIAAFLVRDAWACAALLGVGYLFLCSFGGSCTAALQLMVPQSFRGRISALYLVTLNIFGLGLGPLVVGAITEGVFHDRAMVGASVAITVALATTASILCLSFGRRAHARTIFAVESGNLSVANDSQTAIGRSV